MPFSKGWALGNWLEESQLKS